MPTYDELKRLEKKKEEEEFKKGYERLIRRLGKLPESVARDYDEMPAWDLPQNLYQFAIGELAVKYLQNLKIEMPEPIIESEALRLIEEIREILNDLDRPDADCVEQVRKIMRAFDKRALTTRSMNP